MSKKVTKVFQSTTTQKELITTVQINREQLIDMLKTSNILKNTNMSFLNDETNLKIFIECDDCGHSNEIEEFVGLLNIQHRLRTTECENSEEVL